MHDRIMSYYRMWGLMSVFVTVFCLMAAIALTTSGTGLSYDQILLIPIIGLFIGVILMGGYWREADVDPMIQSELRTAGIRFGFGMLLGSLVSLALIPEFLNQVPWQMVVSATIIPFTTFLLVLNAMMHFVFYPKWARKGQTRTSLFPHLSQNEEKQERGILVCRDCLTVMLPIEERCWRCHSERMISLSGDLSYRETSSR
jgi:hypothetical protein